MESIKTEQLERDIRKQYVKLLDLLALTLRANKDLSIKDVGEYERLSDACGLALKFFCHALSVLYLSHGTNQQLPSVTWHRVDFASMDVITRAAMEAFLVFHYVFCPPAAIEKEEKDYRYLAYQAEGIDNKLDVIAFTDEQRERLTKLRQERDKIYSKLESNAIYLRLSPKQQKMVFKGKSMWRWNPNDKKRLSWRDIAIQAGFSKFLAQNVYSHLSESTHSSKVGVSQTMPVGSRIDEEYIYSGTAIIMNIMVANLIQNYCTLFPRAQRVLDTDIEGSNFVNQWIQRGCRLDKRIGMYQDDG